MPCKAKEDLKDRNEELKRSTRLLAQVLLADIAL